MKKHWSEVYSCQCGMRFRSYATEARHRHNFPALCRRKKARTAARKCAESAPDTTDNGPQSPAPGETTPQIR